MAIRCSPKQQDNPRNDRGYVLGTLIRPTHASASSRASRASATSAAVEQTTAASDVTIGAAKKYIQLRSAMTVHPISRVTISGSAARVLRRLITLN